MALNNGRFIYAVWFAVIVLCFAVALHKASNDAIVQAIASLVGGAVSAAAAVIAVSYQLRRQDDQRREQEARLRRVLADELRPRAAKASLVWLRYLADYESSYPRFGGKLPILQAVPTEWQFPPAAASALRQYDPTFEVREKQLERMASEYDAALNEVKGWNASEELYDKSPMSMGALKAHDSFLFALAALASGICRLLEDLEPDRSRDVAKQLEAGFGQAIRLWGINNPHGFALVF